MQKDNKYVFFFAFIVAFSCSLLISIVAFKLDKNKKYNESIDLKKNILVAMKLDDNLNESNIEKKYNDFVDSYLIDINGEYILDKKILPEKVNVLKEIRKKQKGIYPLYIYKKNNKIESYCIPIVGKGLWSTIKGYLALEKDLNTIRGITFYQHGETAGLGAEISSKWFTGNFIGKKIFDKNGTLESVTVSKGKVRDFKNEHKVDGITGATLTGNGVTVLLKMSLNIYLPYIRKNSKGNVNATN